MITDRVIGVLIIPFVAVDTVHGTSQRPTGSAKGKERANAGPDTMLPESILESPHLGSRTAVGVDSVAQGSSRTTQEATPSALERKKPPRNRSLLESVQAHLTLGTKSFPAGKEIQSQKRREPLDTERHCDMPFPNHEKLSTVPSLLSRLSNSVEAAQRTEGGPELNALASPPSTAHRHQELSADNQPTSQSTKMSAPEIMARTRARMIKNLATPDPPSISQLQTAGTLSARPGRHDSPILSAPMAIPPDLDSAKDLPSRMLDDREDIPRPPCASTSARGCATNESPLQIQQIPVSGELDGGDLRHHEDPCDTHMAIWGNPIDDRLPISTHINDISHPSTSPDARAKLLARLEQEKTHASLADTTRGLALPEHGHDRTFPTVDTEGRSISAIQGQAIDTSAVDPQMMEAKLRTRAQLQVRLAAEKKK
ncbi:hypothetical protein FPV67DRAFT_1677267 [Lyophyllum atratum]|nr:hypothetical protein FPV67DRAFT_1677267 [Lyophyllum atratum]